MSTIMDRLLEVIRVVGRSSPAETVRSVLPMMASSPGGAAAT